MGVAMICGSFPWLKFVLVGLALSVVVVFVFSLLTSASLLPTFVGSGVIIVSSCIVSAVVTMACGGDDIVGTFGWCVCMTLLSFGFVSMIGNFIFIRLIAYDD